MVLFAWCVFILWLPMNLMLTPTPNTMVRYWGIFKVVKASNWIATTWKDCPWLRKLKALVLTTWEAEKWLKHECGVWCQVLMVHYWEKLRCSTITLAITLCWWLTFQIARHRVYFKCWLCWWGFYGVKHDIWQSLVCIADLDACGRLFLTYFKEGMGSHMTFLFFGSQKSLHTQDDTHNMFN